MLVARAGLVQVVYADATAAHANLTQQADGGLRYQYNPRLVGAGRLLPRGAILDRTGLPLATSDPSTLTPFAARLRSLGLAPSCTTGAADRCYPLGGLAFHLIGDADRQLNWAARNTSFAEQDFDAQLKGLRRPSADGDRRAPTRRRDVHRGATRLCRAAAPGAPQGQPVSAAVRAILDRDRTVRLTIDAGLQVAVARAVRDRAVASGIWPWRGGRARPGERRAARRRQLSVARTVRTCAASA